MLNVIIASMNQSIDQAIDRSINQSINFHLLSPWQQNKRVNKKEKLI